MEFENEIVEKINKVKQQILKANEIEELPFFNERDALIEAIVEVSYETKIKIVDLLKIYNIEILP